MKSFVLPVLRLLYLQNKQTLMRLRYDVGRELVLIFSSATLLGLFYYMFHDFLHTKLADVSAELRSGLSHKFLVAVLLLIGPLAAGSVRGLWQRGAGWIAFASRSGERSPVLHSFRGLQTLLILCAYYGFYYEVLVPRFTFTGSLWPWLIGSIVLGAGRLFLLSGERADSGEGTGRKQLRPILGDADQSRAQTLFLWRWHQLIRRNRMARLCLVLTLILSVLTGLMIVLAWPFFLIILGTMLASLLIAAALAFQLEEDVRSAWFERQIGCSHEEFVAVYQRLCYGIGMAYGLVMLGASALLRDPSRLSWMEGWKILPIAALFPALLPAVMFQLAPDRPLLQILVTALMGLFLATAIFAHGGALVLFPLLTYYAMQYQKDNFYRTE